MYVVIIIIIIIPIIIPIVIVIAQAFLPTLTAPTAALHTGTEVGRWEANCDVAESLFLDEKMKVGSEAMDGRLLLSGNEAAGWFGGREETEERQRQKQKKRGE